ncbi:hypothetical protein LTS10_006300 [Elasticomyces elasticus]|nr:hypothetical protein LTS10_006300 [Elasticomyces elasticus]
MAAAAQVLELPELLEAILVGLPTKDLLFAQKVCGFWKRTIETSTSIQKALYLVPGNACDVNGDYNNYYSLIYPDELQMALNPLLFDRRPNNPNIWGFPVSMMRDLEHHSWSCARMFITQPPRQAKASLETTLFNSHGRYLDSVWRTFATRGNHKVRNLAKQFREALASFEGTCAKVVPTQLLLHIFSDNGS